MTAMTASDRIKAENRIESVLESKSITVYGEGRQRTCRCHSTRTFSILQPERREQVWKCHAGCGGGSVVDLLAKFAGMPTDEYLRLEAKKEAPLAVQLRKPLPPPQPPTLRLRSRKSTSIPMPLALRCSRSCA